MKLKIYPLKMTEELNLEVKILAARENLSMQDWMVKAISEKINRDSNSHDVKTYNLLQRAYRFVRGGPSPDLENDLKEFCELYSGR